MHYISTINMFLNVFPFLSGLETESLDQYGTGTAWPAWFSPLRNLLELKAVEAILMILVSSGEMQQDHDERDNISDDY